MKLNRKHEYTPSPVRGDRWDWIVTNAHGTANLWISKSTWSDEDHWSGGIEIHWNTAPEHRKHDAPDHAACHFTKQPCWHDGSSLAAERAVEMQRGDRLSHSIAFGFAEDFLFDHTIGLMESEDE